MSKFLDTRQSDQHDERTDTDPSDIGDEPARNDRRASRHTRPIAAPSLAGSVACPVHIEAVGER